MSNLKIVIGETTLEINFYTIRGVKLAPPVLLQTQPNRSGEVLKIGRLLPKSGDLTDKLYSDGIMYHSAKHKPPISPYQDRMQ